MVRALAEWDSDPQVAFHAAGRLRSETLRVSAEPASLPVGDRGGVTLCWASVLSLGRVSALAPHPAAPAPAFAGAPAPPGSGRASRDRETIQQADGDNEFAFIEPVVG